jgi:thiamine biosynthesis lipoprotein
LRIGLGTFIAIEAAGLPGHDAAAAIDAAFAAIELVQTLMRPAEAHSDVTALNTGVPGFAVRLHAWTWELLWLAQHLNRLSHGLFDPCLPDGAGRLYDLELPEPPVAIPHARLNIDLGGIAKGYAVDRAIIALRAAGCSDGLVNAGGDLRAFGPSSHDIVCRGRGAGLASVPLQDAALAMSDAGCDESPPAHRGYYAGGAEILSAHRGYYAGGAEILSAHRGYYAGGAEILSAHRGYYAGGGSGRLGAGIVAVMAGTAAVADALTKCLLAGRPGACTALFAACGARQIELRPE